MFHKIKALMLISFFLFTGRVFAQLSYSFSTEQEYSDNPFHSQLATKTLISSLDYGLEHNSDLLTIGYNGSYYNFEAIPERNFYWHQLSASKSFESSTVGILAEQRLGKDIYTYFNYTNITGYYTHQFAVSNFNIMLSPNVSLSKYPSISILDNLKISLNSSVNYGFETGTTFILGGAFTYKKYLSPTQSGTYSYINETNQLITESYTDKNVSSVIQMLSFLRAAQSITPSTGIAAQFTNRSILSRVGSFVKDLNMIYGDESEIFDDPVNYEGNNFSIELTQILFDNLTIKGSFFFNNKFYPSQGIYDEAYNYNTGIMRSDEQKIFNFSLNKNFSLGDSNDFSLSVGLKYQWIDNQSNSSLFNYKSNLININVGLNF
jgi:hypothetical protein